MRGDHIVKRWEEEGRWGAVMEPCKKSCDGDLQKGKEGGAGAKICCWYVQLMLISTDEPGLLDSWIQYMSVMPHKIKGFKLLGVRLDINSKWHLWWERSKGHKWWPRVLYVQLRLSALVTGGWIEKAPLLYFNNTFAKFWKIPTEYKFFKRRPFFKNMFGNWYSFENINSHQTFKTGCIFNLCWSLWNIFEW